MKKTIIIITIILAVLAIGAGVYFGWQKSQEILNPPANSSSTAQKPFIDNQNFAATNNNQANQNTQSAAPALALKALSTGPVFDYWLSAQSVGTSTASSTNSGNIFYLDQDGKIFSISLSDSRANNNLFSSSTKLNLQSVKASPDGKMILIKYGDLARPIFALFDVQKKTSKAFANILVGAFSPDSKKLAYLDNATPANLMIKDLTTTAQKNTKTFSVNANDFDLVWNNTNNILFVSKPSSQYQGDIWSLDLRTNTMALVDSEKGLMVNWSKDGKIGLRFKDNDDRSSDLTLIDNTGKTLANLDFTTIPTKCGFGQILTVATSSTFYCALPQAYNTPSPPTLPDDYLKRAVYFTDFIYKIDMGQNTFDPIYVDANKPIDADHITVFQNKLFFVNRYDDRLYSLDLK